MRPGHATAPVAGASTVRLVLADDPGEGLTDGAWWPRSTSLAAELPRLLLALPEDTGLVARVRFSLEDWDPVASRIGLDRGTYVTAVPFARPGRYVVVLETLARSCLTFLVVPSALSREQGEEALLAALSFRSVRSAGALIQEVVDQPPHLEHRRWTT